MGGHNRTIRVADSIAILPPRKNGGLLLLALCSREKKYTTGIAKMDQKYGVHCW